MTAAIVIGLVLGVVIVAAIVARSRRSRDGVDSFRRQIDALSPEARRPVVDQVQSAASRIETRPIDDDSTGDAATGDDVPGDDDPPDAGDAPTTPGGDDDATDDGGARGT